jgi:hypothetical protein
MQMIDREILRSIATEVLKTHACVSCKVAQKVPPPLDTTYLRAEIAFMGTRIGEFAMIAPKPLCCEWAIKLMGEQSSSGFADALGRMANAICSKWLSTTFAVSEKIKFMPANVKVSDAASVESLFHSPNSVLLVVCGRPVLLNASTLS